MQSCGQTSFDNAWSTAMAGVPAMPSISGMIRHKEGGKTPMQNHLRLDSFDLSLSDIASVEGKMLHALSLGVGWPHRPEDWDMLRLMG
jgi:hypothetical protein